MALTNGLNANMLRRWVRESETTGEGGAQLRDVARPAFMPLPMSTQLTAPAPAPEQTAVRVEVESLLARQNGDATCGTSATVDFAFLLELPKKFLSELSPVDTGGGLNGFGDRIVIERGP